MTKNPNISGVHLAGKTVQLYQSFFRKDLKAEDNLFLCQGGFACHPKAMGRKVFGTFLSDNEEACITRSDVQYIIED
jgi:alpha-galactosidase